MASFSCLDDDVVLGIASYGAPEDLLNLALTCRRLGSKTGAATGREWRRMARDAKRQKTRLREWSLMDEAARRVVETMVEEERTCLPLRYGEGWMSRFRQLMLLRRPLTFDHLIGDGAVVNQDNSEVRFESDSRPAYCTALSDHIMRAGKHYASFTLTGNVSSYDTGLVRVGVFRPTMDTELKGDELCYLALIQEINKRWDAGYINYCALVLDGFCNWSGPGADEVNYSTWQGRESFQQEDAAGLLLDLDEGTLTVYKNGRKLGVLGSGLAGEYCWGVSISGSDGVSVKISRGAIPA